MAERLWAREARPIAESAVIARDRRNQKERHLGMLGWGWDWVTQGRPKRHPSVTPGTRKGHAWDTQGLNGGSGFVCNGR